MSTIRIFSKRAFAIGPGASRDGSVDSFITVPNAIQDMPDKYENDKTFRHAVECGDIQIMNAPVAVAVAVASASVADKTFDDSENVSSVDPVEEFYESLKIKNKEEVKKLAEEYGAEYIETDKLSQNKKRVFEAYKLSVSNSADSAEN